MSVTDQLIGGCGSWSSKTALAIGQLVGDGEAGLGRHQPLLDGAGHGDDLVGRPRLVDVGDGPVVLALARRTGRAGAVAGHVGHGQDAAGAGVCDDGQAAPGGGGPDGVDQRPLQLVLERLVEREDQVGAPHGRLEAAVALGDAPALRVLLDDQLAGLAGQLLVVLHLEAGQAVVVDADVAEQRARPACPTGRSASTPARSRRPRGPASPRLRRWRRRPCGPGRRRRGSSGRAGRPASFGVDAEQRGELGGVAGRVGDDLGVGPHGLLVDRQRQVDAVAVEDGAPLGGQA